MTLNSKLCVFILEHPGCWRGLLKDKKIRIKENETYALFKYGTDADFTDEIVREARGVIIDLETLDIVCRPFTKFGNWNEIYADKIDWESAAAEDKIDGSIIKLWFSKKYCRWVFSTNSEIYAENAKTDDGTGFFDLIFDTPEYLNVLRRAIADSICGAPSVLDKDMTYIFELVHPKAKIVIEYKEPHLWHLGIRNNLAGNESSYKIPGIPHPGAVKVTSLEDAIKKASCLNEGAKSGVLTKEGFVVVDKDFHRIKIKPEEYFTAHKLQTSKDFPYKTVLSMEKSGYSRRALILFSGDRKDDIKAFFDKEDALLKEVQKICLKTDEMKNAGSSRKEIAAAVQGPLSFAAFTHLDHPALSAEEILENLPESRYLKLLKT